MIIRLSSFILAAATASVFFPGGVIVSASAIDDSDLALTHANSLLAQGKYSDAIALYNTAIGISTVHMGSLILQKKTGKIISRITNAHYHLWDYIDIVQLFLI